MNLNNEQELTTEHMERDLGLTDENKAELTKQMTRCFIIMPLEWALKYRQSVYYPTDWREDEHWSTGAAN